MHNRPHLQCLRHDSPLTPLPPACCHCSRAPQLKPPHHDHLHHDEASSSSSLSSSLSSSRRGWGVGLGRYVQKLLVLPQQRFAALYSRKLAWGILRFQFVAGYLWDKHRPSLDYRWAGRRRARAPVSACVAGVHRLRIDAIMACGLGLHWLALCRGWEGVRLQGMQG